MQAGEFSLDPLAAGAVSVHRPGADGGQRLFPLREGEGNALRPSVRHAIGEREVDEHIIVFVCLFEDRRKFVGREAVSVEIEGIAVARGERDFGVRDEGMSEEVFHRSRPRFQFFRGCGQGRGRDVQQK